jgi:hypothetical protein
MGVNVIKQDLGKPEQKLGGGTIRAVHMQPMDHSMNYSIQNEC